jgi:long-chain-fatty-acid--[acyl-carrier-protein] ligase
MTASAILDYLPDAFQLTRGIDRFLSFPSVPSFDYTQSQLDFEGAPVKTLIEFLLVCTLRFALWFRYRITLKGLDKLTPETLNKPGGVLFLPSHPTVFIDAVTVTIALWPKFRLRPMVVEYMYHLPLVNRVMRLLNALPVPSFTTSSNSLKRKRNEEVTREVIQGLKEGQNFLLFPAGKTKQTAYEAIDGGSATHRVVSEAPQANVVLVRVKGLWGSSFSRALTGKAPALFPTILQRAKYVLKNLLFFTPRRQVILEFEPAPPDFPYHANKLEFNRYLERWYNRPDGLSEQQGAHPGDSTVLVSYSVWHDEYPALWQSTTRFDQEIDLSKVPQTTKDKVYKKIAELVHVEPTSLKPEMFLTTDLGMDSLDTAELVAFLHDAFDITHVNAEEVSTVGRLLAIADHQILCEHSKEEEDPVDTSSWTRPIERKRVEIAEGETLGEVFLKTCHRLKHNAACADARSGVVSYQQLKMRAILLAEYIRNLPGESIGILLPASTAASMTILACELAGKIPLMINWTVGSRHLQAVVEITKVQVVLTSWAFLDRLQNADLTGVEELLITLEDIRQKIGLMKKLKGALLAKCPPKMVLKALKTNPIQKEKPAVILFTSGTEGMPKGVPLSHHNLLSNLRAAVQTLDLYSDDVLYGILPPFHSFGFTISALIGLLSGFRVAYFPDPTDGPQLAEGLQKWGITIICGAPTFIKNMLKSAEADPVKNLRLCILGAEKMPPEIVQYFQQLGKESCVLEGYGITECAPILTFTRPGLPRKGVGQPLPGVELLIIDLETHTPLPAHKQGLILARGANIFSGYLNPGLSSPFLNIEGRQWYVTGDLGYLDEAGNLILSGRLKRFIKVGGEMVSLAAIEEALNQATLSQQAECGQEEGPLLAVTGKELEGGKSQITVYSRFALTIEQANTLLRQAGLSNLVKVTNVKQVAEIPLMGSGKIAYRKLDET